MFGGKITNNHGHGGGGIYTYWGTFNKFGGTISGNKAVQGEDNVYPIYGDGLSNVVICVCVVVVVGVIVGLFLYFKFRKRSFHS